MLDIQRADRAVPPFVRKARRQGWGNEGLGDGRRVPVAGGYVRSGVQRR